eukprot:scaffold200529_cov31-Tisochrysis_lutea.AAC.1
MRVYKQPYVPTHPYQSRCGELQGHVTPRPPNILGDSVATRYGEVPSLLLSATIRATAPHNRLPPSPMGRHFTAPARSATYRPVTHAF